MYPKFCSALANHFIVTQTFYKAVLMAFRDGAVVIFGPNMNHVWKETGATWPTKCFTRLAVLNKDR